MVSVSDSEMVVVTLFKGTRPCRVTFDELLRNTGTLNIVNDRLRELC